MKSILSIDFDVIMAPSIDFYNDSINNRSWSELEENSIIAKIVMGDYMHYQRLTQLLIFFANKIPKEKVHFIMSHEQILNYLNENDEYCLVNIDHHHDLGYGKDDKINCGNWIKYIPNLKDYLWIKNNNSTLPINNSIEYQSIDLQNFDLYNLAVPDEIFICYSIPWIPTSQRPLFFLWMDILNAIYQTHFEIEG